MTKRPRARRRIRLMDEHAEAGHGTSVKKPAVSVG